MYFIKWVGYSSRENTWEPIEHLTNVIYMVDEFEEKRSNLTLTLNLETKCKSQDSNKDSKETTGRVRRRDLKYQNKSIERTNLDYDNLSKNNDGDIQVSFK